MKFQGLVSLMLSPQTKDNITYETTQKLIEYGLTIDNMINISQEDLVEMIFKVSFHNVKAKNIKKLAQKLRDEYNDDAPETLQEIIKFPEIGRKIGLLYLKECCEKVTGIAIDTHIRKIANRLKLGKSVNPLCNESCLLYKDCSYYKDVVSNKKSSNKKAKSQSKDKSKKEKKEKKVKKQKIRKKIIEYESDSEEEL